MKSKTVATALSFLFGWLGAHRAYLYGLRDVWLWVRWPFVPAAIVAVLHWNSVDKIDIWVAWLLPISSFFMAAIWLETILLGLTSEQKWLTKFPTSTAAKGNGLVVFMAVMAFFLAAFCMVSGIAFGIEQLVTQ